MQGYQGQQQQRCIAIGDCGKDESVRFASTAKAKTERIREVIMMFSLDYLSHLGLNGAPFDCSVVARGSASQVSHLILNNQLLTTMLAGVAEWKSNLQAR